MQSSEKDRTAVVDDEDLGGGYADGQVADLVGVAVAEAREEGVVVGGEQRSDVLQAPGVSQHYLSMRVTSWGMRMYRRAVESGGNSHLLLTAERAVSCCTSQWHAANPNTLPVQQRDLYAALALGRLLLVAFREFSSRAGTQCCARDSAEADAPDLELVGAAQHQLPVQGGQQAIRGYDDGACGELAEMTTLSPSAF